MRDCAVEDDYDDRDVDKDDTDVVNTVQGAFMSHSRGINGFAKYNFVV